MQMFLKRSEEVRNAGSSETFRQGQERSGTLDGLKRLQNHVHGTFTFTLQKRKNHFKILKLLSKIVICISQNALPSGYWVRDYA
jgi:hypothetical protein